MYIPDIYHVYTVQVVIYQEKNRNIHGIYHVFTYYMNDIQYICKVYTLYILSIYIVYTEYILIYTRFIPSISKYIQSESMKVLKDLELRSVWILVCAVIGLHST